MKLICLLGLIIFSLISFTNEYSMTWMDNYYKNKSPIPIKKEVTILLELRRLEKKLNENYLDFNDLFKLQQLVETIETMKENVITPTVYWYSRQGR